MSLADLTRRLERSFKKSCGLLTRLHAKLCERRTAWISARSETIAPSLELEELADALRAEDEARRDVIEGIARLLPAPSGFDPRDMHVNVTLISKAIPAAAGRSLRRTADDATAAAKRVRQELALGRRLLGFAMRTHEGLMADLAKVEQPADTRGYDRTANACRGIGTVGASLIDGRM